MSADDLVESVRHLVDNYRLKDDCTPEERYLLNLCEKINIRPGRVANALRDKLVQERKDKSYLQGKYGHVHKEKIDASNSDSKESAPPSSRSRSRRRTPKRVKFRRRSSLKPDKQQTGALSSVLVARSQSPPPSKGDLHKSQYRRSHSGHSVLHASRLDQAIDFVTNNLEVRQRADQEEYREFTRRLEDLHDPAAAQDAAQLVDDNLELILCSSEVHEHIEESMKGKRDMDFVKNLAQDMMADLEGKAAEKRKA